MSGAAIRAARPDTQPFFDADGVRVYCADARRFDPPEPIHLVLTSPPYWTLVGYGSAPGQLGNVADYDTFLDGLDEVWLRCFEALLPGGRLVVVVGDVCLARRAHGEHQVLPLHADILVRCRRIGFRCLTGILWQKVQNATSESGGRAGMLGKPYEPNAIVKNDAEHILMLRKPGGYRQPTAAQREASRITPPLFRRWFQPVWHMSGASTRGAHPAPFPVELADRLVRMFSFAGDTVFDPFAGWGTTLLAAREAGRRAIGIEIEPAHCDAIARRLARAR